MASYRCSLTLVSRSQGRSIVAAAAYRAGESIVDERTGELHDFTNKNEVVHKEILLPDNAPAWMGERAKLWNAVELGEKRKDAQLAREAQLTLPRELTIEQNIALVNEFVKTEFVNQGMVADICIHNPKASDGLDQPHAHILLTLRDVSENGFGLKNRNWNKKEFLKHCREEWSNYENKHLALHGFDIRVDHRSYKDQGIELEPQHKIGPTIAKDRLVRLADHQRIARENGERLFEKPEIALDAITRGQSTFTQQDLARFVNRHTENAEQFQSVFEKIKACPELVFLGLDSEGRERFSTRDMLRLESSMMRHAEALDNRLGHHVDEPAKMAAIACRTLSQEQETALHYLTEKGDLKSLVGYAGTGKSYLLSAAKDAWEKSGYRVQGAALSGISALNLRDSSGIESRTIASLFYRFDKDMQVLTAKDILVVDEAGMVGSRTMERLVREVEDAGAKLVLVGDWQQLQAIEAGASFRAIAETHQYVELNQIRRQTTPWQIEASLDLAQGRVGHALLAYDKHDNLHRFSTQQEARDALISQWNDVRIAKPQESQIILAYTRKDVAALNEMARTQKRKDGELGEDVRFSMERGERAFAVNDRVYFLKREDSLSVINGTLGTIRGIDTESGFITVALDGSDPESKPKLVAVNTNLYKHLEHGYAATVYKGQGVTVDRTYVLPCKLYDAHSTYVAMTRHRQSCDIFVSREVFVHDRELINTLNRNRAKDVTLDYTQMASEFTRQRHIDPNRAPTQELTTPSKIERPLTPVDYAKQFHEQQRLKEERLAALCQSLRDQSSPNAQKSRDYVAALIGQQAKSFAQEFEQHQKALSLGGLRQEHEAGLSRLIDKASNSSALLGALQRDYPQVALHIEQFTQSKEQKIEHLQLMNYEHEI